MKQPAEWSRQAERILATDQTPHFAPAPEVLEVYRSHIKSLLNRLGHLNVLVLGATPELADLALSYDCHVYRVDCNQSMFDAAKRRQKIIDHPNETIICGDWLELPTINDGMIDFVMGDAALNNIPHSHMPGLFKELRRITHPGSMLSVKQIVLPDAPVEAYEFNNTLNAFRKGTLTTTEFYIILRFYSFANIAYDPKQHVLDSEKVFSAFKKQFEADILTQAEFEFLYSRQGTIRHTVYTQNEQKKILEDELGACVLIKPSELCIYDNLYNVFLITIPEQSRS